MLFDLVVLIITWTKLRAAAMDIRSQARVSVVLIRDSKCFHTRPDVVVDLLGWIATFYFRYAATSV